MPKRYGWSMPIDGDMDAVRVINVDSNGDPMPEGGSSEKSDTSNSDSVDVSASSVDLLAANADRISATIHNDSAGILYVLLGTETASVTNFSVVVAPNTSFVLTVPYTGLIKGVWAPGTLSGAAKITEFT